jgi:hypothetical protein
MPTFRRIEEGDRISLISHLAGWRLVGGWWLELQVASAFLFDNVLYLIRKATLHVTC